MDVVLLFLIVIAIVLAVGLFIFNKINKKPQKENREERAVERPNQRNAANRGQRGADAVRNRLRANLANRNNANNNAGDEIDDEIDDVRNFAMGLAGNNRNEDDAEFDEEDQAIANDPFKGKIGAKKLKKLEAKAERKEANLQMQRDREERKEKEKELEAQRKAREEEEARIEKEKEEEEKRLKEEQEKREYEEYLKLKQEFTIDEEGTDAFNSEQDEQNLLQQFIEHIKKSKVVVLEDLAAEFKLRTQDVINRIRHVEEMNLLTGIMDDRGKYIYVSEEELKNVCTFIKQRGRVSISELAQSSSELINMKPEISELIAAES